MNTEPVKLHYTVDGGDILAAGEASADMKRVLKQLGFPSNVIRNAAIAMYEGELNMVIHAGGGEADVEITRDAIRITLTDHGPGIPDVELAMREGYTTAPDSVRMLGFGAGMGLPNMKKYSDELIIDTRIGEGTTVRATVLNREA